MLTQAQLYSSPDKDSMVFFGKAECNQTDEQNSMLGPQYSFMGMCVHRMCSYPTVLYYIYFYSDLILLTFFNSRV